MKVSANENEFICTSVQEKLSSGRVFFPRKIVSGKLCQTFHFLCRFNGTSRRGNCPQVCATPSSTTRSCTAPSWTKLRMWVIAYTALYSFIYVATGYHISYVGSLAFNNLHRFRKGIYNIFLMCRMVFICLVSHLTRWSPIYSLHMPADIYIP